MRARLLATLALSALALGCARPDRAGDTVMVFAAASLRDVGADLARAFERRDGGRVVFNFAGSNTLAQQIRAAPRADVFLSADHRWVEVLQDAGALVPGTARAVFGNRLVAIRHRDSTLAAAGPRQLLAAPFRRLAIAEPEAVPAGRYARAYLEAAAPDLWPRAAARIVPALDVRAVVALVESDPEILGIVYRTDARASARVRVLFELAQRPELPIAYWSAADRGGPNPAGGARFLAFLVRPEALAIARRHGFTAVAG